MAECDYEIRGRGFTLKGVTDQKKFARLKYLMDRLATEMHAEPTVIGAQKYELYDEPETTDREPYISGLL